jgi:hypothetical protein
MKQEDDRDKTLQEAKTAVVAYVKGSMAACSLFPFETSHVSKILR